MECVGARCVKCVIQFSDDPALRLFLPLSRTHRHAGQWRRLASTGNTRAHVREKMAAVGLLMLKLLDKIVFCVNQQKKK